MASNNITLNIDNGVMIRLDTYNELYDRAHALDSIVEGTIATFNLGKRVPTSYNKLPFALNGSLVLPAYVLDQIIDKLVCYLDNQSEDFIPFMVKENMHIIDLGRFAFTSFHDVTNPLEYDLMRNDTFRQRWRDECFKRKNDDGNIDDGNIDEDNNDEEVEA